MPVASHDHDFAPVTTRKHASRTSHTCLEVIWRCRKCVECPGASQGSEAAHRCIEQHHETETFHVSTARYGPRMYVNAMPSRARSICVLHGKRRVKQACCTCVIPSATKDHKQRLLAAPLPCLQDAQHVARLACER